MLTLHATNRPRLIFGKALVEAWRLELLLVIDGAFSCEGQVLALLFRAHCQHAALADFEPTVLLCHKIVCVLLEVGSGDKDGLFVCADDGLVAFELLR